MIRNTKAKNVNIIIPVRDVDSVKNALLYIKTKIKVYPNQIKVIKIIILTATVKKLVKNKKLNMSKKGLYKMKNKITYNISLTNIPK